VIYTVALTGGIGSGKSVITNFFRVFGVAIIDTDIISRELVSIGSPALRSIALRYGKCILTTQNTLDRSKLREIIFQNSTEREWLNHLLHPLIYEKVQLAKLQTRDVPYLLIVVPLLIESGLDYRTNRILVVDTSESLQLERILWRDKAKPQQVKDILSTQVSREKRINIADDIISNIDSLESLSVRVLKLHNKYLKLSINARKSLGY
jgi:dephospho-CoA kinase